MTKTNNAPDEALDVWLKFYEDDGDDAEYEANTYREEGREGRERYRVEWYHNEVGMVRNHHFDTYDGAREWLESEGFIDFTVEN